MVEFRPAVVSVPGERVARPRVLVRVPQAHGAPAPHHQHRALSCPGTYIIHESELSQYSIH